MVQFPIPNFQTFKSRSSEGRQSFASNGIQDSPRTVSQQALKGTSKEARNSVWGHTASKSCLGRPPKRASSRHPKLASSGIQNLPRAASQNLPRAASINLPRSPSQNLPRAASINLPRAASQNLPRAASQNLPQTASQTCLNRPPKLALSSI